MNKNRLVLAMYKLIIYNDCLNLLHLEIFTLSISNKEILFLFDNHCLSLYACFRYINITNAIKHI